MYAQDANYWDTTVPLRKSIADLDQRLMEHCSKTGKQLETDANGLPILIVYWEKDGVSYQAEFRCLPLGPTKRQSVKTISDSLHKRQENQMGRIAWWWMTSALLMHEYGNEEVLLPYAMLPTKTQDGKNISVTLQKQGLEWIFNGTSNMKALPAKSEFIEVEV